MRRLIVGMTGSTGAIFGVRLLEALKHDRHRVPPHHQQVGAAHHRARDQLHGGAGEGARDVVHSPGDMGASHLVRLVHHRRHGRDPLLGAHARRHRQRLRRAPRASRRGCGAQGAPRLVLVVRETPLSEVHLENMLKLARMGVTMLPPMPAFYNHPQTIDDVVNHIVGARARPVRHSCAVREALGRPHAYRRQDRNGRRRRCEKRRLSMAATHVPGRAGIHTPCPLHVALPRKTLGVRGYGLPLARGRRGDSPALLPPARARYRWLPSSRKGPSHDRPLCADQPERAASLHHARRDRAALQGESSSTSGRATIPARHSASSIRTARSRSIVDHEGPGGKPYTVIEFGRDPDVSRREERPVPAQGHWPARYEVIQWLMVQVAGIGPMFGQFTHFNMFAPAGNDYSVSRYQTEVLRLYDLLEERLGAVPYPRRRRILDRRHRHLSVDAQPRCPRRAVGGQAQSRALVQRDRRSARPSRPRSPRVEAIKSNRETATAEDKDRFFGRGRYARA